MRPPSLRVGVLLAAILVLGSCLCFAASSKPAASTGKTGELWEVTSQVSMEGMPMQMPTQKNKICASKSWKEPPGAQNPQQECQVSDFKTVGSKTTWKMQCSSPTMTGDGEITRTSPDAYTGAIKMSSADGSVTIKLSGQKVGECDYAETEAMPAQAEAMSQKLDADLAKMQAEGCKGVAESLQLEVLKLEGTGCNDAATKEIFCKTAFSPEGTKSLIGRGNAMPGSGFKDALDFCANSKSKGAFCAQFHTTSGFDLLASGGTGPGSPQETAATFCGLSAQDVDAEKAKLCKMASAGTSELMFLGKYCPQEAKVVAEKECAGRSFTSMGGSPYAAFCVTYASQMQAGAQPADKPADESDTKKGKTKKLFKSLWPH